MFECTPSVLTWIYFWIRNGLWIRRREMLRQAIGWILPPKHSIHSAFQHLASASSLHPHRDPHSLEWLKVDRVVGCFPCTSPVTPLEDYIPIARHDSCDERIHSCKTCNSNTARKWTNLFTCSNSLPCIYQMSLLLSLVFCFFLLPSKALRDLGGTSFFLAGWPIYLIQLQCGLRAHHTLDTQYCSFNWCSRKHSPCGLVGNLSSR